MGGRDTGEQEEYLLFRKGTSVEEGKRNKRDYNLLKGFVEGRGGEEEG